mgnify:CR=1 FL=1
MHFISSIFFQLGAFAAAAASDDEEVDDDEEEPSALLPARDETKR